MSVDRLIDWVEFDHAVLSVAISYNDEFIATTHEGVLGIYIWANNSYYSDVLFDKAPTAPGGTLILL